MVRSTKNSTALLASETNVMAPATARLASKPRWRMTNIMPAMGSAMSARKRSSVAAPMKGVEGIDVDEDAHRKTVRVDDEELALVPGGHRRNGRTQGSMLQNRRRWEHDRAG